MLCLSVIMFYYLLCYVISVYLQITLMVSWVLVSKISCNYGYELQHTTTTIATTTNSSY